MKTLRTFLESQGYRIVFRSEAIKSGGLHRGLQGQMRAHVTGSERKKAESAPVYLVFDGTTAQLGAPVRWTAPNGVVCIYDRDSRRGGSDDLRPSSGVYHDFNPDNEKVVPLTRNVGPARRALRAWAAEHLVSKVTARFQARQLVRPGD